MHLAPALLLVHTFQGGATAKSSYPAYAEQIVSIKKELAAAGDFKQQNAAITNYLARYQAKNAKKPTDVEVFGTTYRLIYRVYNLGFNSEDKSTTFGKNLVRPLIGLLKDSVEKDICVAFFDMNEGSWMFDRYPDWKKSSVLTMICFSNSVYGIGNQQQYETFRSAYEPAIAELGPTFRKIGFDSVMALGNFFNTKDKKYIREYITLLRDYATKALDKGSAARALKTANQFEEWHFGKKTGG
jgi:hypothetical protein